MVPAAPRAHAKPTTSSRHYRASFLHPDIQSIFYMLERTDCKPREVSVGFLDIIPYSHLSSNYAYRQEQQQTHSNLRAY